jgi:hypothetical protein
MAASDVSICSNALLMLGAQPISSFTENNDRARLASNLFESVRNDVLRSHPWNCCIKRAALASDTEAPAFDWDFQFTLPSDYLRTLAVGEAGSEIEFKIESGKLLCDDNPAYLRYVARNENAATWDDMLVQAMTLAMAAKMAYSITQSSAMRDSMAAEYERHMKRARAVDGQDDTPDTLGDSPLLNSRFGGSFGWGR